MKDQCDGCDSASGAGRRLGLSDWRRWVGALLLVAGFSGVLALTAGTRGEQGSSASGSEVQSVRAALEQWVETQQQIARQKREFALKKEMLRELIEVRKQEIESIRGKIEEAKKSIGKAEESRDELVAERDKLKEASDELQKALEVMEGRTRALLARLPEAVTAIEPLKARLPKEDEESKLSLGERYLTVIGILNEADKFNRQITFRSDRHELPSGETAEVTFLYIGLGQAYYVDKTEQVAGIGTATAAGWEWTPANDAAPQIARAVAMLKDEQAAAFVELPVDIRE